MVLLRIFTTTKAVQMSGSAVHSSPVSFSVNVVESLEQVGERSKLAGANKHTHTERLQAQSAERERVIWKDWFLT